MLIPRYWVRTEKEVKDAQGRLLHVVAWGWSDKNDDEALEKSKERLRRLVSRVEMGGELPTGYGYGDRPLREEILEEFNDSIITRNSYGSTVLNTPSILFMDVDFAAQQEQKSEGGFLSRLFGKGKSDECLQQPENGRLSAIRESLAGKGTFRVYRTAAGFRLLAIDDFYDPVSSDVERLMRHVGADPSFIQLCRAQKSFRARLSPKPWRCSVELPPGSFPRENDRLQKEFERWLVKYEDACRQKATCRFIETVGSADIRSEIRPMVDLHDQRTRANESLPLA